MTLQFELLQLQTLLWLLKQANGAFSRFLSGGNDF
jgi:hypothetical protein